MEVRACPLRGLAARYTDASLESSRFVYGPSRVSCRLKIVVLDVAEDLCQVVSRRRRPADNHLTLEHLFDSPTDLFLSQVLAAVELLDTGRYLLPEPHIIVDIVFNQALHVSIGITLRVCCDAIELGLQFRREVHFHDLRLATSQIDGQASEQQAQMNFYAPSLNASSSPL